MRPSGRGPASPPRPGASGPPERGADRPAAPAGRSRSEAATTTPSSVAERPAPVTIDDPDDGYEYEYEDLPGEGRVPRWIGVLVVFALLIGATVGGAYWLYDRRVDPPGSPGETVSVEIPRGASISGIGAILDREGVVPSAFVFNFYASRKDAGPFEAGVYRLRKNSDIDLVLSTMAEGPTSELGTSTAGVARVQIPEGLTSQELVASIAEQVPRFDSVGLQGAFDRAEIDTALRPEDQPSYEGLLFPATYEVDADSSEADVLGLLADEMEARVSALDPAAAKGLVKEQFGIDVSTYQLITVASLVQAEAGNAAEAPMIATVIYNRLAQDSTALTLGIDAVDNYGAAQAGVDVATFRETAQPYNTRKVKGLPPTPISAPGDFALAAAFAPAAGPWLYYVLTEERVHTFAVTPAEFAAAKEICAQKNLGCD